MQPAATFSPATSNQDATNGSPRLIGRISSIVFRDEFTGKTTARIVPETKRKSITYYTITGHFAYELFPGECVEVEGEWLEPQKHLLVKKLKRRPPATREGEIVFLAGFIKGLSKTQAAMLLDECGGLSGLIEVCKKNPERLDELLPRSRKVRARLRTASWDREDEQDIDLYTSLHSAGVRTNQINEMIRRLGASGLRVIAQTRPYDLCEVKNVGFSTADKVAAFYAAEQGRSFNPLDPMRLLYGIVDAVGKERVRGHICIPEEELLTRAVRTIRDPKGNPLPNTPETRQALKQALDEALKRRLLIKEYGMIYTRGLHHAETDVALRIAKMITAGGAVDRREIKVAKKVMEGSTLTDEQQNAVIMALTKPISIITAGPGCGKTFTTAKIIEAIKALDRSFLILAPTGKAAMRSAEATGETAETIHRACWLDSEGDIHGKRFGRPLTRYDYFRVDYILVDESSMMDLPLGYELIRRIKPGRTRLIFVGDVDQLPPVGPGQVFRDLLESGVIPVQRLTKVFRQAGGSPIIDGAYAINSGKAPGAPDNSYEVRILNPLSSKKYRPDLGEEDRNELEAAIVTSWLRYTMQHYAVAPEVKQLLGRDVIPAQDFQVYAPQKNGHAGINQLNEIIRDILNPIPAELKNRQEAIRIAGRYVVSVGDKVMQTVNNYKLRFCANAPKEAYEEFLDRKRQKEKEERIRKRKATREAKRETDTYDVVPVMNGQVGYVVRVDPKAREIEVKYDELAYSVLYKTGDEWRQLAPAWAMSIHKSQGSETPFAFIIMHSATFMANRPLLYTAWTRAKKGVVLISSPQKIKTAVSSLDGVLRYSNLSRRLKEYVSAVS